MIREVSYEDLQYIYDLGKELDPKYADLYDLRKVLADKNQKIYGYYKNNIILGFIHLTISFEEADIIDINIQKDFRNQGLGSSMINYALCTNNLKKLNLEVRENNINAIKFYEKLGFVKVRTIKNYYGNENAFFMIKVL